MTMRVSEDTVTVIIDRKLARLFSATLMWRWLLSDLDRQ